MTASGCAGCGGPALRTLCAGCEARRPAAREERHPLDAAATEAQRQQAVREALQAAGWKVWRVGQRDARGTQDPGVSDMICLARGRGVLFVEVKDDEGRQSADQAEFQADCDAAGVPYVLARSSGDVRQWLSRA